MFFLVSKLLWLLTQPSNLAALVVAAGLLTLFRKRRRGLNMVLLGFGCLLLFGFSPLGNILIYPLEQRFAGLAEPSEADHVAGIIMLGGFEDGWVSAGRPGLATNEAGERLTGAMLLARHLPNAKLVFTGGDGSLWGSATAEGAVQRYLLESGVAPERLVLEHKSRTTWENAKYLNDILRPKPGDRYVLVTSAFHMPRSVGTFRQAGFDVLPYPVDYRTRDAGDMIYPFSSLDAGLQRVDMAVKEWIGLVAYRLSGRSAALWPGPSP